MQHVKKRQEPCGNIIPSEQLYCSLVWAQYLSSTFEQGHQYGCRHQKPSIRRGRCIFMVLLPEKKEGYLRLKACSSVVAHIDTEAHRVCRLNLLTTASCKLGTWTTQRKTKGFRTGNCSCDSFVTVHMLSRIVRVCDELHAAPA